MCTPFGTGTNLKFCRINKLQCCDDEYFERRQMEVISLLREDLRKEIYGQIDRLDAIVDAVENSKP